MEKVASASGCVLWKENNKIYAIRTGSAGISVAVFVFLLLAFIFSANGILWAVFAYTGKADSKIPGLIFLLAGIVFTFFTFGLIKSKRKSNNRLPDSENCICVFDLSKRKIYDGNEKEIGSFSNSSLERKFQMTSSSKKLVLVCSGKEIDLAKGNPFDGGIYAVEDYLKGIGIK